MKKVYFAIGLTVLIFSFPIWTYYHAPPDYLKYFQKVGSIQLEEPDGNFIGRIAQMEIAENGRIVLRDDVSTKIIFYEKDGKFLQKIGAMGNKPGEFMKLYGMDVQGGLICCYDDGLKQVTLFDDYGTVKKVFSTENTDAYAFGVAIAFSGNGTILCGEQPKTAVKNATDALSFPWLIREYDLQGQRIRAFGKYDQHVIGNEFAHLVPVLPYVNGQRKGDKVYFGLSGIPKVVVMDSNRVQTDVIDITTSMTRPQQNSEEYRRMSFENKPQPTIIMSVSVLEGDDVLLVNLLKSKGNLRKRDNRFFYLSAFDLASDNQPIVTDIPLPFDSNEIPFTPVLAIGPDDLVYILESDTPQNFTIGVYRFLHPKKAGQPSPSSL